MKIPCSKCGKKPTCNEALSLRDGKSCYLTCDCKETPCYGSEYYATYMWYTKWAKVDPEQFPKIEQKINL